MSAVLAPPEIVAEVVGACVLHDKPTIGVLYNRGPLTRFESPALTLQGRVPVPSVVVDYCHTCGLRWSHWLGCTDTRRTVAPFHLPDIEETP